MGEIGLDYQDSRNLFFVKLLGNMNKKIFVDSDAFIVLAKEDYSNHQNAVSLLQKFIQESIVFFISNYVLSEC